ncbi:siroheme decarboxylase subunit alpha [Candidatus Lucifugimonas marina]|jgi:DNA-binding Lrp family transcriptional regulator|uniref:siroheme decarboxylase n=1 Tax=Candidatus Lucifugimonas marina TaxID=3038979 RepID=A0AAJ5ZEK4_9CHLR|nr:Lrp/AsnC family transcriptional regulator [SAR202 cluster bacterium JH702]MDG0870372.1 Lrp/AsnC family transcriptional regulator [SAR202 cluster bacterium JH639]WFG36072.1 Lrp/AsnC family transcriptional regulator [SAR202 cluster bacterium JH545]WFG40017.1 Lrp/AsnC family transcriptional regulator [SAR202 cluster bacterium JH1073]
MPFDEFDPIDREIMNTIQAAFPLVAEPYKAIADTVGTTEQDVIDRIDGLRKKNVVRQIGAIFDTRKLKYQSMLVAMQFPDDKLDKAARFLNRHPGISHNYERDGHFNLWFTIAVPPDRSLEGEVEKLGVLTGATSTRLLPTIKFFKIGVNFDMVKGKSNATEGYRPDDQGTTSTTSPDVTQDIIDYVKVMQEDLAPVSRPFDSMAEKLGMTVDEMFARADELVEQKLMRRYSAVLHHRRAGFSSNAMIVWKVPEERSEEIGTIMAQHPAVTHCYQRPTYEDWPYSHFTMVHGTSEEECERFGNEIAESTGMDERALVYSLREYKKTRVRYFVEDEFVVDELQPIG